jgi:hypothetical protein
MHLMRANEVPDPGQYVTLEVTIPKDSEDTMTALRGLTTAFGLPVRERPALSADLDNPLLPESWQIQDKHFAETSRELWKFDDYGVSIAGHLRWMRKNFPLWANGTVNRPIPESMQNVEVAGAPFIPLWKDGERQSSNTGYDLTNQELLARARIFWDHCHFPFTLSTTFSEIPACNRKIDLSAGAMTRERLADHVRANRRDKHNLHGALGKMLDTMCVVAGVTGEDAIGERDVDTEFVEAGEFKQILTDSGLGKRTTNDIQKRVGAAIREQLHSGESYEHGEIIVEGMVVHDSQYERIATSSVAALAKGYKNKNAPGAQFLSQFA